MAECSHKVPNTHQLNQPCCHKLPLTFLGEQNAVVTIHVRQVGNRADPLSNKKCIHKSAMNGQFQTDDLHQKQNENHKPSLDTISHKTSLQDKTWSIPTFNKRKTKNKASSLSPKNHVGQHEMTIHAKVHPTRERQVKPRVCQHGVVPAQKESECQSEGDWSTVNDQIMCTFQITHGQQINMWLKRHV